MTDLRPLEPPGVLLRASPFVGIALLAFALAPLPPRVDSGKMNVALALTGCILLLGARAPWGRLPGWAQALPPFAYLAVVALLRDAEGGAASGVSSLMMIPVFWLALYGSRRQLGVTIVGVAAVFLIPVYADPTHYPATEWERAILWIGIACVVGYSVQDLVKRIRDQAEKLGELSRTDDVTGLPNGRGWDEEAHQRLLALSDEEDAAVVSLNFDERGALAERQGSRAVETLVRTAATVWSRHLHARDLLAHRGPAGFRLLLCGHRAADALSIVDGLRAGTPGYQRVNCGVAFRVEGEPVDALVDRAENALREAELRGSGTTIVADTETADERLLRQLLVQAGQ